MMKKNLKHALAVALITGFVILAIGSAGSSPSSYSNSYDSGGGSSGKSSTYYVYIKYTTPNSTNLQMSIETVQAYSIREAEDEGERIFRRKFPNYTVQGVEAQKLF
jgi:hypothetical protein